jgi:alkylation response protein AidB-like acyl-CoA dehydrogenase
MPVVTVFGEQALFSRLHGSAAESDGEKVQHFMTWEEQNFSSLQASLSAARDALHLRAQRLLAGELGHEYLSLIVPFFAENARAADLVCDIAHGCFRLYGADGIWDGDPLQRRLRDAFTIAQHASANDGSITRAGAAMLGQRVGIDYA